MKRYVYETCCIDIPPERIPDLNEMILNAKEVGYETMLKRCRGFLDWGKQHGYTVRGQGLHLKNDWCVGYYRSTFDGKPCYFVRWSAIEFIWVRGGQC